MIPYVLCPECQRRIDLDDEIGNSFKSIQVRETTIRCSAGHNFTLFEGLISLGLQPDHYNIFWPIKGIETGQERIRVGEWCRVKPKKSFEEIDEVQTIFFPEGEGIQLPGVRTGASFNRKSTNEFLLMSSGLEREWGKTIIVNWIIYGVVSGSDIEIWRENLTFAARQLLGANYRPSVIQSAVAVESFVYEYVTTYLRDIAKWNPKNIKDYVEGASIDSLSIQGLIRIFIQEMMSIEIPKDVFVSWMRLKNMRDALAHGDLNRYRHLTAPDGHKFVGDKERAEFAYSVAVRFIYEVLYPAK
jgi:hypothetical protein